MKNAVAPIDAYRDAVFRKAVIAQLHQGKAEGKPPEQVAREIAGEQRAIAKAIVTPEFIDAASNVPLPELLALHHGHPPMSKLDSYRWSGGLACHAGDT
jgi:hypothetical protein